MSIFKSFTNQQQAIKRNHKHMTNANGIETEINSAITIFNTAWSELDHHVLTSSVWLSHEYIKTLHTSL